MKARQAFAAPTILATALALTPPIFAQVTEPRTQRLLEISLPDSPAIKLSAGQILERPSVVSLVLNKTPEYPDRTMRFKAVPMTDLVPARFARSELSVIFECLDGFAATIPAERVLGREGPRAFLAVEDPASPWPPLKNHPEATAGPFYLIWQATPSMRVAPEEWPYQIRSIAVREAQGEFRGIRPETGEGVDSRVRAGFDIFVRNCSPCHRLNGVGNGDVGPDLNSPMNPIEYFREGIFEKYVRDPASLVRWPDQKMPSFPADVLTDAELSELRAYLEHMARHRNPAASPRKAD